MAAEDPGWIEEFFLTPCTSPNGEAVRTAEVDWIAGKSQGTRPAIRALIDLGASLEKMIMLFCLILRNQKKFLDASMKLPILNQNGFTLLELLLVMILIGLVAIVSLHRWIL